MVRHKDRTDSFQPPGVRADDRRQRGRLRRVRDQPPLGGVAVGATVLTSQGPNCAGQLPPRSDVLCSGWASCPLSGGATQPLRLLSEVEGAATAPETPSRRSAQVQLEMQEAVLDAPVKKGSVTGSFSSPATLTVWTATDATYQLRCEFEGNAASQVRIVRMRESELRRSGQARVRTATECPPGGPLQPRGLGGRSLGAAWRPCVARQAG